MAITDNQLAKQVAEDVQFEATNLPNTVGQSCKLQSGNRAAQVPLYYGLPNRQLK